MSWFFLVLISSLGYATTNHIDKYLIEKHLKKGEVGSLILFSSLFSVFALPIVFFIHPEVFSVSFVQGIALATTGIMSVCAILFYLCALQKDEATNVVPFYQTIPVFGFILGYLVLGETITPAQTIASLFIIAGALVLSLELGMGVIRIKRRVAVFMLSASLLYAMSSVVFKLVALEEGFWLSTFWSLTGTVLMGVFFLVAIPRYRNQFFSLLKENKVRILALNSINETLTILADFLSNFATLLAPIALVMLVQAFQPVFVLLIGVMLTLFFPHIGKESLSKKHLFQKIFAVCTIVIGSYFLGT
jgi:drug/metabolite transporter (DMT)-like permease